ncbi:MAG: diacylglycerol kinase family protein, partial [Hyphomonadaceae bacterium]
LCNEKSGRVSAGDGAALAAQLEALGVRTGDIIDGLDMEALFARARDADLIVVLGGDGTARAAAAAAPAGAPPLVLLPGGTLNLLPKALYGDLSWPEALEAALRRGEIKTMSGAAANGEPFFIAAMFGAPTLLARAREAARAGDIAHAYARLRHFAGRAFSRKIAARAAGARTRRSEAVGVLCAAFSGQMESDDLEWVHMNARSFLDLARINVRALGAGWREDSGIETSRCAGGELKRRGVIPATLDGEPRSFLSHVRIERLPQGPRVLALPHDGSR